VLKVVRSIAWTVLASSFAILAVFYQYLPSEIVIYRSLFDGSTLSAPRTPFTVFRVPSIELICGVAIEVMRTVGRSAQPANAYDRLWSTLLVTVAFKSLFQSLETVTVGVLTTGFFYATVLVVAAGVVCAVAPGYRAITEWIHHREKLKGSYLLFTFLLSLLLLYLVLALVPLYLYK
jgi:hypothetical protein